VHPLPLEVAALEWQALRPNLGTIGEDGALTAEPRIERSPDPRILSSAVIAQLKPEATLEGERKACEGFR